MIILTLRTDKPEAELGLFNDATELDHETWLAHHELSKTLHTTMESLLARNKKQWSDVTGIVCYRGPGSFTGLRIGLSVVNALAYAFDIPIVALNGEDWQAAGVRALQQGTNDHLAVPEYGMPPHTTTQKH